MSFTGLVHAAHTVGWGVFLRSTLEVMLEGFWVGYIP